MVRRRIGTVRITRRVTIRRQVRITTTVRPLPAPRSEPIRLPSPPQRLIYSAPLGSIRAAADEYSDQAGLAPEDKPADVFVCHASDDKDEIARPLAQALREQDLEVWYDEFMLDIGDSLPQKIDEGLIQCRFGVVILSPAFFGHGWRRYELDGLVTKEVAGGKQLILPVWHNVSQADVLGYSPTLASKVARSTREYSVEQIAVEIARVARA
jgi:hypothetical protein